MENIDRSRGFDNNYHCIARGILKNKSQIEVPDKAENRTRLRTEQEQAEQRPRSKSRDRLTETEDLEQRLQREIATKSREQVHQQLKFDWRLWDL